MRQHAAIPSARQAQSEPVAKRTAVTAGNQANFIDNRQSSIAQRALQTQIDDSPRMVAQREQQALSKPNNTGLPDNLKSGIESLSGMSMDHVKVHYNSPQPAQLNAHAYAQGSAIHVAPGQEQHLPHEAWHVVQQAQGRVRPTIQMKDGINVNDDGNLEAEADAMGEKARSGGNIDAPGIQLKRGIHPLPPIQRIQEPATKNKRHRESDKGSDESSQSEQLEKPHIQLHSEIMQLAIDDEVKPGTRIMVTNPSARDAGDIGTVIGPSTVKDRCMRVKFDNKRDVYRVYFHEITVISTPVQQKEKREPQLLNEMIMNVIRTVQEIPNALAAVMDSDKTQKIEIAPVQQLEACLVACAELSAEDTATYLYTTYFFGPLNKYLRNPDPNMTKPIKELISVTHALLIRAFKGSAGEKLVPTFRMELQAEWIGDKAVGENLSFPALTSTHPNLPGVNAMWTDIENGTFGKVTKLALLIFEGDSKFLNPKTKYFPRENEIILPPGIDAEIVKKYDINWDQPGGRGRVAKKWTITVYHLKMMTGAPGVSSPSLAFTHKGNVKIAEH
jgi:hypothetical protein